MPAKCRRESTRILPSRTRVASPRVIRQIATLPGTETIMVRAMLLVVCGCVLAASPSKAADDPDVPAILKRLASETFAERDAAHKQLRSLGLKALPAVKAGQANPDPVIA